MNRFTRYGRKMRIVYAATAIVACGIMSAMFPWLSHINHKDSGCYVVRYKGNEIGILNQSELAEEAFNNARKKVLDEIEGIVYLDAEYEIKEKDYAFGTYDTYEDIEAGFYEAMKKETLNAKKEVYVIDIEGLTITLSSLEEVEELLNASKKAYDVNGEFQVVINANNERLMSYEYKLIKADTEDQKLPTVTIDEEGVNSSETVEDTATESIEKDGVKAMSFAEDIKVITTYASADKVMSLEDAISEVTKAKETNEVYEVVAGDTLSKIAKKYDLTIAQILAMNSYLSEDDYLHIGDQVVVTVPKPELSVVVQEQKSYTEEYNLPIEYIYNDKQFTTYSKVKKEGTSGVRDVVAMVTYCNGMETGREIIKEDVKKAATAKVVEVGTKTPPTYIKPITGGRISSRFGYRTLFGKRKFHKGIDWAIPTGTTVRAACSGTVITAGWGGSYGYYVVIKHSDGSTTTYAHLSKILCKKGKKVSQGEKIALSGNTGNSTGPHLHFEIKINGKNVNPLSKI